MDLGSDPDLEITVTENLELIARFSQPTPQLDLSSNTGGTVTGSGIYNLGETVHLQALANDGYIFTGWEGEGVDDTNASSTEIVMSENRLVYATFGLQPSNTHSLVLESVPAQGGKTSGSGPYRTGATVNISATSYPGYTFDRWDGNGIEQPTESITSIILSDNSRAQAIFSPVIYQLDVNHTDGGLTLGAGSYPYGTSVNLTALALDGYSFLRWEGVEIDKQFSPEISIPILGSTSVKAIFEPIQYKLEIESTNGGVAYGQGLYDQGTLVHIRAVPSTGYQFSGWDGNGIDNKDLTESTISLNQDTLITANFVLMDNFFTPRAGNFSLWVDRKDYQSNDLFYHLYLEER